MKGLDTGQILSSSATFICYDKQTHEADKAAKAAKLEAEKAAEEAKKAEQA